MITADQLIAAGYRKSKSPGSKQFTDILYQKRIDDTNGKKYFINIWEWDNREHKRRNPELPMNDFSYQADAQMTDRHGSTFNMEMLSPESVERVEAFMESTWRLLECEYYEEFNC